MDIAFIGVDIEPGEHEIELKYHSRGALSGLILTMIGIVLTMIIMLRWKSVLYGTSDDK